MIVRKLGQSRSIDPISANELMMSCRFQDIVTPAHVFVSTWLKFSLSFISLGLLLSNKAEKRYMFFIFP